MRITYTLFKIQRAGLIFLSLYMLMALPPPLNGLNKITFINIERGLCSLPDFPGNFRKCLLDFIELEDTERSASHCCQGVLQSNSPFLGPSTQMLVGRHPGQRFLSPTSRGMRGKTPPSLQLCSNRGYIRK